MPINYLEAAAQIREMGAHARQRETQLAEQLALARRLLAEYAGQGEALADLVERAGRLNPHLRCALPTHERLDASVAAEGVVPPYVLLAADGSQVFPDRHAAVEFGAVNVGAIRLGPGQPPQERVSSRLLYDEALYHDHRPIGELDIGILRDLAERRLLLALAQDESAAGLAVVTLTDGPLELYSQERQSPFFAEQLPLYLDALRDLARLNAAVAGYVDKPRSDLLSASLELVLLEREGKLPQAGRERLLWLVRDADLFGPLLAPGRRSALFQLHGDSASSFTGQLAMYSFFLNVGCEHHPHLARVDVPRWVAQDEPLLNLLQAVLLTQSAQMGARPFPYVLHRAHEIAVVHPEEANQLEAMIVAELRHQGAAVGEQSNKQAAKELAGRTRMGR